MKKQILVLVLFLILVESVYCNDTISSKIIFYREHNFQGSAVPYKIFIGDHMVVKLRNNSYYSYNCLPGEYDFRIDNPNNSNKLHLNIEQGKTYYLCIVIRNGFWSVTPELLLVDSISAYPSIYEGSMRRLDINNPYLARPKNRIGFNISLGGGFEKYPFVENDSGDKANISFGGGYSFGLKYGHEFNRHFDLAVDLNYQFSDLTPSVKNASITFSRGILSVTPSYIIPILDGDVMRVKLGAGLDSYLNPKLEINTDKLSGGFNDNWTYKNSFGYHLSAIFETNASNHFSFCYGLKWYNVSYSFEKSNNYDPLEKKLKTPNGSGIDLVMGFYYHF